MMVNDGALDVSTMEITSHAYRLEVVATRNHIAGVILAEGANHAAN